MRKPAMVECISGSHGTMKKVGPFTGKTNAVKARLRTRSHDWEEERPTSYDATRRAGTLNF
jgi:hypothetical protein